MTPSATSSHLKGYQGQSPWLVSSPFSKRGFEQTVPSFPPRNVAESTGDDPDEYGHRIAEHTPTHGIGTEDAGLAAGSR